MNWILWLIAALSALGMAAAVGIVAAVCLSARRVYEPVPAQCIIVPGAKIWPDGHMTGTLEKRCRRALELWRRDETAVIIPCGGRGGDEPAAEGAVMRMFFLENGVPEERIFAECSSRNTQENLKNAKEIMDALELSTAVIVTSDYHVRRALWLAKDLGINAQGMSAPSPATPRAYRSARLREACSWVLYGLRKGFSAMHELGSKCLIFCTKQHDRT